MISNDIFYRNYISTGIASYLAKAYNHFEVLIYDDVDYQANLNFQKYTFDKRHEKHHYQFLKILSWRKRNLSRTFKYRFLRTAQFYTVTVYDLKSWSKLKLILWKNWRSFLRRAKILFFANRIIFPMTNLIFKFILKPDASLETYVQQFRPDAVLMPSSAYDPAVIDMISICRRNNVKSILLVDNWDNLSSKSVLWCRPDLVAVWGEQTKEHAIQIQGFKEEQITSIGTPRFEQYFKKRDIVLLSHFDFKYVLFVGQMLPSNELRIVEIINDILCSSQFKDTGIKLVYRPHPWAQDQTKASVEHLKAVIVDPQIYQKDPDLESVEKFQPNLDYYPSLLQNAQFVVSSLTSMIIEASIFRKNVIAIAHMEANNYTSPHRILREYRHFEGIEVLPNLIISHTEENLIKEFKSLLEATEHVNEISLDMKLKRFLNCEGTYNKRLLEMLDENI